jgi:cold shock CspA family protein
MLSRMVFFVALSGVSKASSLVLSRAPIGIRAAAPLRALTTMQDMETKKGKCKWFDSTKGFGFIAVDDSEQDIFVHQSDIYAPGFRSLAEGEDLEFKVTSDPRTGKLKAVEVTGPEGNYVQGAPRQDFGDGY